MHPLVNKGAQAALLALVGAPSTSPLVGGAADMALNWVRERYQERQADRLRNGFEALVRELATVSPTEVADTLGEHRPETVDTLVEFFRVLTELMSAEAVPYAARMTAEYIALGKPRDPFFRRVGRLLLDVDTETVLELAKLFDLVRAAARERQVDPTKWSDQRVMISQNPGDDFSVRFGQSENWTRSAAVLGAIEILKSSHLISSASNSFGGNQTEFVAFEGSRLENLTRLVRLFRSG